MSNITPRGRHNSVFRGCIKLLSYSDNKVEKGKIL
jgi:hypothetical protein